MHPTAQFVAMEAWKSVNLGITEDFQGFRVVKLPKMILLMPTAGKWPPEHPRGYNTFFEIVAYPKPAHLPDFQRALQSVWERGPSAEFPGAIGTIKLWTPGKSHLSLTLAQAHFRIGGEHGLSHKLASHYGGWRREAMSHLLQLAKQRGFEVEVDNTVLCHGSGNFKVDVEAACRRTGVAMHSQDGKVRLSPLRP